MTNFRNTGDDNAFASFKIEGNRVIFDRPSLSTDHRELILELNTLPSKAIDYTKAKRPNDARMMLNAYNKALELGVSF